MPSERLQRRIDHLLDEAEQAIEQEQWERALEMAKLVFSVDPDNADARSFVKLAEVGLGKAGRSTQSPDTAVSSTDAATLNSLPRGDLSPASFANGRYTVKKKLGEGGKKRVYLAHDTVLDRDVAFALIKTEGLDDAARQRITREAQAMGRLGDHPNIMPIFDLGVEPSPSQGEGTAQPYMVLPIMTGGDVEGLIKKASDHRLPLDRLLAITRDVCSGLSFAHSRGIVHRDLKPGNVWLTTEGTARIGDFGLAIATDRSRLTREGMMVGTVSYMPPEQAMGGEITPRADLYSLGAMLYEMVTGRPPYLGDDDIAIIGQHINTPPVAPTWHRPDCPKTLDSLIMRLLAKDPKQRPESARDVLSALEAVETVTMPAKAGIQSAAQRPDRSAPSGRLDPSLRRDGDTRKADGESSVGAASADSPRSLDSMSSGVFVGRQKEMDQLRAALEEVLSGHGRLVTLVGEPGIGKTRTAEELATYAGLRRCQVLWGRCYEGGGAPPYWPWVQAIRSYVRARPPDELRKEMGSTASVIAEVVADIKDRLPEVKPPPQLDDQKAARFRLFDSISSFLRTASQSQPLVLMLDDLHWADVPTLSLLEFVAKELTGSRLLLVGAYRDVELSRKHPLSATLGDLTRERAFERVVLRGLTRNDIARFIEVAAGTVPPEALADTVFKHTEGNPLFVTEVVRLLVQDGTLSRIGQERGTSKTRTTNWTVRIPEGIREAIGRRLNRLSDRTNNVLTTAAVIGRQFTLRQLLALFSGEDTPVEERLTERMLLEVIEEALEGRIIEELPREAGSYQFTHALMQETLTSELSLTRRVRLHARIAEALERLYGDKATKHAAELVVHFDQAQTVLGTDRLARYSLSAGNVALAGMAFEDALGYFSKGQAAIPDSERKLRAELMLGLARAQLATLQRVERRRGVATLRDSVNLFIELGDTASAISAAMVNVVPVAGGPGIGTEFSRIIESVLPLAGPGSRQRCLLLGRLHGLLRIEGPEDPRLESLIVEARQIADSLEDADLKYACARESHFGIGVVRDRADLERVETAARLASSRGDSFTEVRLQGTLAVNAYATERPEIFLPATQKFLNMSERLRDISSMEQAIGLCAWAENLAGNWSRGREYADRCGLIAPDNLIWYFKPRVENAMQTGDTETVSRFIQRTASLLNAGGPLSLEVLQGATYILTPAVRVMGLSQWLKRAEETNRAALESHFVPYMRRRASEQLAFLHIVLRGDVHEACRRFEQFVPQESASPFATPLDMGSIQLKALLASVAGLNDEANSWFDRAVADAREKGLKPRLAWTLEDFATHLLKLGGRENTERARTMHDEALKITREMGMNTLTERILKRRQFLKA